MTEMTVELEPKEFMDVPAERRDNKYDVSPKIADVFWDGVQIATPRVARVTLTTHATLLRIPLPLACYYSLGKEDLQGLASPLVKVRNKATGEELVGKVASKDDAIFVVPVIPDEHASTMSVAGYLSFNMADYINFPAVAAVYAVSLQIGSVVSNVCEVEIILK